MADDNNGNTHPEADSIVAGAGRSNLCSTWWYETEEGVSMIGSSDSQECYISHAGRLTLTAALGSAGSASSRHRPPRQQHSSQMTSFSSLTTVILKRRTHIPVKTQCERAFTKKLSPEMSRRRSARSRCNFLICTRRLVTDAGC